MILRPALLLLALALPGLAWGQEYDPTGRIARLSYVEGEVRFLGADERATTTLPDRPLIAGDRLATERGGRAELALGNATLRIDENSELELVALDDAAIRVELLRGTASVYLNELLEDETFEIVTPNTAITLDEPGEYRADVFDDDATTFTVRKGYASVDAADGAVRVGAGQRVVLDGRDAEARLVSPRSPDDFDNWVLDREVRLAEAEPPRYTPFDDGEYDDDYGYEELDRYGEWYDDPGYGRVWMPSYGYSSWSPYYGGYWQRSGFGWSWYDPAPWGYFTYFSGRWTYLNDRHRWCWVPAPRPQPRAWDVARRERLVAVRPGNLPRRATPDVAPRTPNRRSVATTPSIPRRIDPDTARPPPRRIDAERRPARTRIDDAPVERSRAGGGGNDGNARGQDRERVASRTVATPSHSQGGGARERPSRPERARSESKPERPERQPQNRREFGVQPTP